MRSCRRYLFVWLIMLVVSGCGQSGPALETRIGLTALPAGIGRGFPVVSLQEIANTAAAPNQGAPAPNFYLVLDNGDYLSLADLQGQPIVLNFWATWCSPCRREMPELVAAATANPDLIVLAVNVQEELARLQPFASEFQLPMPVVQDPLGELRRHYAVRAMPTTIFIDRTGKIATIWTGVLTKEVLTQRLAEIE